MNWIDIIQSVGIVCSIVLVLWQMRLQVKELKAAKSAMLTAKMDEINRLLFEHPEILPALSQAYPRRASARGDRRRHLMLMWFNAIEQAFLNYRRYKLVEKSGWEAWMRILTSYLYLPYVRAHWERTKIEYAAEFQRFVNDLLAEHDESNKTAPPRSTRAPGARPRKRTRADI